MKRVLYGAAVLLLSAGILGGCGNTDKPLGQLKAENYVTLGDYQNLEVTAERKEVTEEELKQLLAEVYMGYADAGFGTVDREVRVGDTVIIDYDGTLDGEAFDGGSAQDTKLTIGSGVVIEGFEDGLIGAKPGETVVLTLNFPEDYQNSPELAGKEVVFTVAVRYVIPGNEEDMDDAVVAAMELEDNSVTTIAQLKRYLLGLLELDAQYAYENELQSAIGEALLRRCSFKESPEYLVEEYRTMLTAELERAAEKYGVTIEGYTLYFYGMTSEQFMDKYLVNILNRDIALQAIANREGLAVDDEELDEKLSRDAQEGGYSSVDEMLDGRTREQLRTEYMSEKVYNFLMEK